MTDKNFFNNSQKVFKFFRLWSYREGDNKTISARFFKWMVLISTGFFLVIVSLSETIEQFRHGEIFVAVTRGLYLGALTGCTYKMGCVTFFDNEIYACIKQFEKLSDKLMDTSDIDKGLRLYKKMFFIGLCFMNPCTLLFLLEPLKTGEYRPLVLTPTLPYLNVVKTPNWQLLYLLEIVGAFVITLTMIAYDTLFCGMMCLCSAVIRTICREIKEFEDCIDDHQTSNIKMKETVVKIIEITELTGRISDIFSASSMIHMGYTCNTLVLGLFMVMLLPFIDLTCIFMILVIILQTFQLWIYCYFGQDIVNQREILQRELYFTRWYDASKNFKGMLLLTLLQTQVDQYIYAGKVIPLSLETLTEVVKKAYVIVTFLNESI